MLSSLGPSKYSMEHSPGRVVGADDGNPAWKFGFVDLRTHGRESRALDPAAGRQPQ